MKQQPTNDTRADSAATEHETAHTHYLSTLIFDSCGDTRALSFTSSFISCCIMNCFLVPMLPTCPMLVFHVCWWDEMSCLWVQCQCWKCGQLPGDVAHQVSVVWNTSWQMEPF